MKHTYLIGFACICCFIFTACHRQALEDLEYGTAKIPVHIDWSVSGVTPQNVTMLFYNKKDGTLVLEHHFENNDAAIQSYVQLFPGIYSVLVFNELPGQIQNVNIENKSKLSEIEAYGKKMANALLASASLTYMNSPGKLASVLVDKLEITDEMVYYSNLVSASSTANPLWTGSEFESTVTALMGLIPLERTATFELNAGIKGLNYARMPALINISNLSGGYYFQTNENSMIPVTYQFTSKDSEFNPGSATDGFITGNVDLFGVLGNPDSVTDQPADQPILLELIFMLVDSDKTIVKRTFDITQLIKFRKEPGGHMILSLTIQDPEPLPVVTPDGNSGFGTNVVNWEIIDVPLVAN